MSKIFYTNVAVLGDNILYRGIRDGKRIKERVPMEPSLFILSKDKTEYKTLEGQYVGKVDFGSIKEAREFYHKYKDIENFKIYGNMNFEYVYIGQEHKNDIQWDKNLIRIDNVDIEVDSTNGFPKPEIASEEVTAITVIRNGKVYAFGCGDFDKRATEELYDCQVIYYKCDNEIDLLSKYMRFWEEDTPDIVTGWYIQFFDIPYLINRVKKLFGETVAKRFSPWGQIYERKVILMGKDHQSYNITGVGILDYIELYRKFGKGGTSVENYKLDTIAEVVLKQKKLSYEEYGNLYTLCKENFQKFIEYNIRDVKLVEKIDEKEKLIDLALTLSYESKTNFNDVFTQTRMWDAIIYNWLADRNIVIPQQVSHDKDTQFIGALVKEPQIGKHKWVVSLDLTSLYPHIQMGWNLSPETIVDPKNYPADIREMVGQISIDNMLEKKVDLSPLKKHNLTVTPNGQIFRRDILGFMPEIIAKKFANRKRYKDLMLKAEGDLEIAKQNKKDTKELEYTISKYNAFQSNEKISLNSCFGTQGSPYFRFFDVRQAEAITTYGQLVIRWGQKYLNVHLNKISQTTGVDYVIASDTDSIYFTLETLIDKVFPTLPTTEKVINFMDKVCRENIQPVIDKLYQELANYTNAYAQKMIMKREKLCDTAIAVGGKNYIWNVWDSEGVRYKEPKLSIVGLTMIKSQTPKLARDKLKKVIPYVLGDDPSPLHNWLEEFREEFKTASIEDVATPTSMKGLVEYSDKTGKNLYIKGTPIHVRASMLYNELIKKNKLDRIYPLIQDGEKIKYLYLKMPNPTLENVIAFTTILPPEFGLHQYVDYTQQFQKSVEKPLSAVLDAIGWTLEKQSSFDSFWED